MPQTLALMVQIEENYGSYRAVARVVLAQETGDLHNPSWHGYGFNFDTDNGDDGQRFAGLEVSAYAGSRSSVGDDTDSQLWGFGVHYAPFRVENSAHAKAIASVLGQVERGMAKLETTDGYIRDGEFSRYVMRAAKALRIKRVYVRNAPRVRAMTGELYRVVDATSLDYWTQTVTEAIEKRELSELVRG